MPIPSVAHRLFVGIFLLCWTLASALTHGQEAVNYVEGEVLVSFKGTATQQTAETTLKRKSLRFVRRFDHISKLRGKSMGLVRNKGKTTQALIEELRTDPTVETVEPNYLRYPNALPNDTRFNELWALKNTGQTVNNIVGTSGADVGYEAAWSKAREVSETVVVGVIDTGVQYSHPDLLPRMWTNEREIPGNGIDDDLNGYTDDYYGFDFIEGNANILDADLHGTHVAGTIGAQGNNNQGVIGINDRVKIMALKVSANGDTMSASAIIEAIEYAITMKQRGVPIVALNASYGSTSYSTFERNAIASAGSVGIILCAAAGNTKGGNDNDIRPEYPASYNLSNIITVAATDQNDGLASFSHYGKTSVDIAAPGVNILSTVPLVQIQVGSKTYAAERMLYSGRITELSSQVIYCRHGDAKDFSPSVSGKIALIERGGSYFNEKVANAQAAGAVAAIIYNNVSGSFGGTLQNPGNWIPAVAISRADGLAIKAALPTSATLSIGTGFEFLQGTSMAAPHVTGAVAFAAMNFPNETVTERVQRILRSVDVKSSLQGKIITGGRLNLQKIVDATLDGIPDWLALDLPIENAALLPSSLIHQPYNESIIATQGTAPYTFRMTNGSPPAGLSLSSSGVLSGTPTEAGQFTFTVLVADSSGKTGGKAFTLYIAAEPLQVTSTETLPPGTTEGPYNVTLSATGGSAPYTWTLINGSLPEGITLSSNGVLSGLPLSTSSSTFTVKVEDAGMMVDEQELSLTILQSPITVLTESTLTYGIKSLLYTFNLEAEGGTPPYTWTRYSGNLPSGLGLNSNGTLTGKPTTPGTYQFRLLVEDDVGIITSRQFSLAIRSVYTAPTMNPLNLSSTYVGADYSATLTATDYPTSFKVTGLPKGLKYSSKTGVISGRPQQHGDFTVVATAKNPGGTSAEESGLLTIRALDEEWIGSFTGIIHRDDAMPQSLGSRFTLTTTSLGAYTLKVTTGASSKSAKGYLVEAAPQIRVSIQDQLLELTLDPVTELITGTHGNATVEGWRIPWHAKTKPASSFIGYYSAALNPITGQGLGDAAIPQGSSYFTMNVKTSGVASITGRSATGDKLTSSMGLGPMGQAYLYQSLYKNKGNLLGTFDTDVGSSESAEDNTLSGSASWLKPSDTSRLYPSGFGPVPLSLTGGYLALKSSGSIAHGLPVTGSADLIFDEAGLSSSDTDPNILDFDITAAFLPVLPALNPAHTTLKINKASGAVTGSFTLIEEDSGLKRKVSFQGIAVPQAQAGVKALGYFLLPQIPATGQKANATSILSGGFQIQQGLNEE